MISYADYFQIGNIDGYHKYVSTYIKANNSLGIRSSNPQNTRYGLRGYWKVSKNDMAMATSTFPNGNQLKSIMNRLRIIENKIRRIEAYNDYNLDSNDYTYTDD